MKQHPSGSPGRRWPGRVRTAALLLLCLALIVGGMLLPREICRWIEQRQFDRVVQLDGSGNDVQPLNFLQRLALVTQPNTMSYLLEENTAHSYGVVQQDVSQAEQEQNRTQTAASAFESVMTFIRQMNEYTGLPYFDAEVSDWGQSLSGFDSEQGKPSPTTGLVLDRLTGQGSVFWYVDAYPTAGAYGCSATVDDETGLVVQYHYYRGNMDATVYSGIVSVLASGLAEYWGLQVLGIQEIMDDAYGTWVSPGWILLSDEGGNMLRVVVDIDASSISLNLSYADQSYADLSVATPVN